MLLGPALLDMLRLQGRETILHLHDVGKRMVDHGVLAPKTNGSFAANQHLGIPLVNIEETARIAPSIRWEMTLQHARIFERTKQLASIITDDLQIPELRPKGYQAAVEDVDKPIEIPESSYELEKDLPKKRGVLWVVVL